MKSNRIFINELPEFATDSEIKSLFSEYGSVTAIEIKERKTQQAQSLRFAFVNLETDNHKLQQCFQEFAQNPWHGQYIQLQIAKESFLERLKREREETNKKIVPNVESINLNDNNNFIKPVETTPTNGFNVKIVNKKRKEISSSGSDSDSDTDLGEACVELKTVEEPSEDSIIELKNNKHKVLTGSLKIEGFGKEPIIKIERQKPKSLDPHRFAADQKRVQSFLQMKKDYDQQKRLIKSALSNVDFTPTNKIVFDSTGESIGPKVAAGKNQEVVTPNTQTVNNKRKDLFEEDENSDLDIDGDAFEIKKQFEGESGQKLLKLQSKYKNDKRFALDERFLDESKTDLEGEDIDELTIESEKKKEYEILAQILGKSISHAPKEKGLKSTPKVMRRFDPTQPEHSKFELKPEAPTKDKRKLKKSEQIEVREGTEEPIVSKDLFYKVADDFKSSLEEPMSFSLLNTFGTAEDKEDEQIEDVAIPIPKNKNISESNPFRYDSTDDEDESTNIPIADKNAFDSKPAANNSLKMWSEPLFFKEDDYRFQEGIDFVRRIATDEKCDFGQLRRNLKEMARNKVRNVQRKNKPFKKKLGGNKRKKMNRINNALKR